MSQHPPPKFKDYTKAYFDEAGVIDQQKRTELIIVYTPLIKYIAQRLAARLPDHIAIDDLISSGIVGLIDAVSKFDLSKKVQFKTYAEFRIKGAMLDELRALDWVPRSVKEKISTLEDAYSTLERQLGRPSTDEETAQFLDLDLEMFYKLLDETKSVTFVDVDLLNERAPKLNNSCDSLRDGGDYDPFAALNFRQTRDILAQAVGQLSEKEKLVVSLYYFEELTMKEIGEVLGYTESRISQMHSKAVLRLRGKLKETLGS